MKSTVPKILFSKIKKSNNLKDYDIGGTCSTDGKMITIDKILIGKPGENMPLGRPRRRWKDSIKIYLKNGA
jgi:hypothetical protein